MIKPKHSQTFNSKTNPIAIDPEEKAPTDSRSSSKISSDEKEEESASVEFEKGPKPARKVAHTMPVPSPKVIESIPYIKSLLDISADPLELLEDFKGEIKSTIKDQYSAIRVFGNGLKAGHSQILAFTFAYFERFLAPGAPDFLYKALIESLPVEDRTESLFTTCLFPKMEKALIIPSGIGKCFSVIKKGRSEGETLCKISADQNGILGKLSTLVVASGAEEEPSIKSIVVNGKNLPASAWRAIANGMSCTIVVLNQEEEEETKSRKSKKEKMTHKGDINVLSGPISILVTEEYSAILYSHEEAIKYADTKEVMDKLIHGKCQSELKKCQAECERLGAVISEKEESYAAEINIAHEEQAKKEADRMKMDETTIDCTKELLGSLGPFFHAFAQLASKQALSSPEDISNGLKEIEAGVDKIRCLYSDPGPKEIISKPTMDIIDEISRIKQEDLEKLSEKLEKPEVPRKKDDPQLPPPAPKMISKCIECYKVVPEQNIQVNCGCLICYGCRKIKMLEVSNKNGALGDVQCKTHKASIDYQHQKVVDKGLAKKLANLIPDVLLPSQIDLSHPEPIVVPHPASFDVPNPELVLVDISCCLCNRAISIDDARQAEGCTDVTCVACIKRLMRESIDQHAKKVRCKCGREYSVPILSEADKTLFDKYNDAMVNLA